jgi:hypothetical protein
MAWEPISPELALVDPDLAARARAGLEGPRAPSHPPRTAPPAPAPATPAGDRQRPYPFWARVTAAVWLLALGIMIGGAAIPHAQDTPRVIPRDEDVTVCKRPTRPTSPTPGAGRGISLHVTGTARTDARVAAP